MWRHFPGIFLAFSWHVPGGGKFGWEEGTIHDSTEAKHGGTLGPWKLGAKSWREKLSEFGGLAGLGRLFILKKWIFI